MLSLPHSEEHGRNSAVLAPSDPGPATREWWWSCVRVDEKSAGIAASQGPGGATIPLARGSTVAVTGRAWVEDSKGAEPSRDTGDLRRVEQYASETTRDAESFRYDQAVRAAADELGHSLGRLVLGLPEPTVEPF